MPCVDLAQNNRETSELSNSYKFVQIHTDDGIHSDNGYLDTCYNPPGLPLMVLWLVAEVAETLSID